MASLVRRLAGFSTLPFLSAILPLIALPFVARVGGVEGWASFNVGQAIGGYAAAVGYVGWNVLGTPAVAALATRDERLAVYARSFYARVVVVAGVGVLSVVLAAVLSPPRTALVAVTFALAGALGGLGLSWYAVGVSSIWIIVWYEIAPRALATVVAIPLIVWTRDIAWYGVTMVLAAVGGVLAFHLRSFGSPLPRWGGWRRVRDDIAHYRAGWGVEVAGNLYASAPVPVAAATASVEDSARYGSADRLYRYGLLAVVAVGNALQGWVLEAAGEGRRRRNRVSIVIAVLLGLVGAAVLVVWGVPASTLLFGETVAAEPAALAWLACAYFAVAASTPLIRNVLMPARRERAVLTVTLIGAAIGLVAMIAFGVTTGTSGVAAGFALSEALTLVACIYLTYRVGLTDTPRQRRAR